MIGESPLIATEPEIVTHRKKYQRLVIKLIASR
jgi:hypothetical protein